MAAADHIVGDLDFGAATTSGGRVTVLPDNEGGSSATDTVGSNGPTLGTSNGNTIATFDGAQYLSWPLQAGVNNRPSQQGFAYWIRPHSVAPAFQEPLTTWNTDGSASTERLNTTIATSNLEVYGAPGAWIRSVAGFYAANTWVFLYVHFDGSATGEDRLRVFSVDTGGTVTEHTTTSNGNAIGATLATPTGNQLIGAYDSFETDAFDGDLGARIWALDGLLTTAEILELANIDPPVDLGIDPDLDASGSAAFELATSGTASLDPVDLDAAGSGSFEFSTSGTANAPAASGSAAFELTTSGTAEVVVPPVVGLLDSGNSGIVTTGSGSVNVTVSSGNGNRKLLVGFATESSTNTDVATLTFNGQELVALGLEVPSSEANPDAFARVKFFEQFEGGMPANGTAALDFTFTSATGDKAIFFWLVDNARQDQLATGAANSVTGAGGAGTTIGTTITAAAAGAFLASVAYKNNTTGTLALTAPGSSTTDGDLSGAGGGDRLGGGHKEGELSVGSNAVTWTHSSESRRALSVVLVEPAIPERDASGTVELAPFATSGTAELGDQDAAGSAAFEFATDGTADRGRVADGVVELAPFESPGSASSTLADGAASFGFATSGTAVHPLVASGTAVFTFGAGGFAIGPGAGGVVDLEPFATSGTAAVLVQGSGTVDLEPFATPGVAQTVQQSAGSAAFGFASSGAAAAVRQASGAGAFEFATAGVAELVPSAAGSAAFELVSFGTAERILATAATVTASDRLRVAVDSTDDLRTRAQATDRLRVRVVAEDS